MRRQNILLFAVVLLVAACETPPVRPDRAPADPVPAGPAPANPVPANRSSSGSTAARWSVQFRTSPPGGAIQVGDRVIEHGQTIALLAGEYRATARRDGFREGGRRFIVGPENPDNVVVELGPAFGTVRIDASPGKTNVRIDGLTVSASDSLELRAGKHRLEAAAPEHFVHEEEFELAPGQHQVLAIELEPLPTAAPAEFTAHHPEASLMLDGSEIGTGAVKLESLEFGMHRLESVRALDSWRREHAAIEFTFERDGPDAFRTENAKMQWRFDGDWLSRPQARAAENARYESARVDRPAKLTVAGSEQLVRELVALGNPAGWLHRHMQAGDRMRVSIGDDQWTLWKRAPEPQPAFIQSVEGLVSGQPYPLPWDDDINQAGPDNRCRASHPHELVYALATTFGNAPLLDLEQTILKAAPSQSVSIATAASDGGVELIAYGGTGLSLNGQTLQSDAAYVIRRTIDQPGTHTLQWQIPPQRIAVLPASGPLRDDTNAEPLKANEKRLIELDAPSPPTAIVQITIPPEAAEAAVRWERIEAAAGPAGALDLRKVELGPHARPGAYRRIWIIEYPTANGASQLQYQRRYAVASEALRTDTDIFLRRKTEDKNIMDEDS